MKKVKTLRGDFPVQTHVLVEQAKRALRFGEAPSDGFQIRRLPGVVLRVFARAVNRVVVESRLRKQAIKQTLDVLPAAALGGADLHGIQCDFHRYNLGPALGIRKGKIWDGTRECGAGVEHFARELRILRSGAEFSGA